MELPVRSYPSVQEAEQYIEGLEAEIALTGNVQKSMSKKLIESLLMIDHRPSRESGSWQSGMRTARSIVFDLMGTPVEPISHGNLVTRSYLHYPMPEKDDGSGHGSLYPLPEALPRRVLERGTTGSVVREKPSVTLSREWPSGITVQKESTRFSGWARPSIRGQPTESVSDQRSEESSRTPVRDRLSLGLKRKRRNSFERGSRIAPRVQSYRGVIRRLTGRERPGVGEVWIGAQETVQHFCERYGLEDPTPPPPQENDDEFSLGSAPEAECPFEPEVQLDYPDEGSEELYHTEPRGLVIAGSVEWERDVASGVTIFPTAAESAAGTTFPRGAGVAGNDQDRPVLPRKGRAARLLESLRAL